MHRRSSHESGASAVEFALVVPVLMALLFGIIEFSNYHSRQITVTNAAMVGAREMAIKNDSAAAKSKASVAGAVSLATVSVSPSPCTEGQNVTVQITSHEASLTSLFGATFKIEGKGVARCNG